MNKKIYFDTTFLHYGEDLRGIPQVIFQLIRLILSSQAFLTIHFIATKKVRDQFLIPLGVNEARIETIGLIPFFSRDIRFHGFLCGIRYMKIKKRAAFIIHPEYRTVVSLKIPQMVLFHDFFFLNENDTVSLLKPTTFYKFCYRIYIRNKCYSATRAMFLVTVSEYTKSVMVRLFPFVKASTVTVLHNGIRFPVAVHSKVKNIFPINSLRLLSVGGLDESRKNIGALIQHIPDIVGNRSFVFHLVGKCPEKKKQEYADMSRSAGIADSIFFHGIVSNEKLRTFYEDALFFLLPSLSEGFGLPMIEAMAHGCIVCAFNNTSIPEIGADAIILAENNDFISWGIKIKEIIQDETAFTLFSTRAQQHAMIFSEEAMFRRYNNFFINLFHLEQKGNGNA